MDSTFFSFPITDFNTTKQQVLNWINQFNTCCFLDNHQHHFNHQQYECIAAAGVTAMLQANAGDALQQLKQFQQIHTGWLFGHLGYDLKNEIEQLASAHPDGVGFPDLFFFVPQTVLLITPQKISITANSEKEAEQLLLDITAIHIRNSAPAEEPITFQQRFSKADYLASIAQLQAHILRGDCYEINFCQEFFANNIQIHPIAAYERLSRLSPAPFAAFYKVDHKYLLCASPERYLKKEGNRLISQPIKGTSKREADGVADNQNKLALYNSAKDRSENVMVVDLVRNDLSRLCIPGTVQVEELFGIYSFAQVHQMISTIYGSLLPGLSLTDIIRSSFPMGSMTGAPKKKVMELIEQYERSKRGIFSGAVGFIAPGGDFDFNVVIRSILYNEERNYLSYQVGSGITFYSEPEAEYEECLLKASAIKAVFATAT